MKSIAQIGFEKMAASPDTFSHFTCIGLLKGICPLNVFSLLLYWKYKITHIQYCLSNVRHAPTSSCLGPPFANRYIANPLAVGAGRRSRSSLQENAVHPLHAENVINRTVVSLRGLTKRQCKERKSLHIRRNKQADRRTEGQSANRTSKGTMLGMCALLFVTFSLNLSCE